jgi:uncharacterized protein involved in exopolysaccharide biosynthesis
MLPGRKYRPEDILKLIWVYKWLLVVPVLIGGIAMTIYARSLPDIYYSEAMIQVVPQGIPESFVRSTITAQLGERLQTISQQILSRSRLEALIVEFNLYPAARRSTPMQDIVERMHQRDIKVSESISRTRTRGSKGGSFVVGFSSDSPRTAVRVAERLASMFIEENLRQRTGQAEVTDKFMESQLESTRRELEQHERRLEEYRRRHASSLPTQLTANTSGLQTTQQQLNNLVEKTMHDRERRLVLERQIADVAALQIVEASASARPAAARRSPSTLPSGSGRTASSATRGTQPGRGSAAARTSRGGGGRQQGGSASTAVLPAAGAESTAGERLERARLALVALELRLKPDHPDIGIARRQIAELERLAEEEALQAPVASATTAGLTPAEIKQQQQVKSLRDEMEMLDRQIARKEEEEKALRTKLAMYQARIEETPTRETELSALTRDYDTIESQYKGLLKKKADSKIATELESRQIAEQFRILEPPREPQRPSSPDRQRLQVIGLMSGLALGVLMAGLLEYRDRSFKTDNDIMVALSLPVLAVVPTIVTHSDRRRRVRRRLVLTASALALVLVMLGLVAWKFQLLNRWLA